MDNRIPGCVILLGLILLTAPSRADDDWWTVRLEQFNYPQFRKAVSRVDGLLQKVQDLTELLAESSDNELIQQQGFFISVSRVPAEQPVTFSVKGEELRHHTILNWEVQYIGFPNLLIQLKGYGLATQREILQLRLENLNLKNAPEPEIRDLERSLRNLEHEIKDFTSKAKWVD